MTTLIDVLAFVLAGAFITFLMLFTNDFLKSPSSAASVWQPWLTAIGVIAAAFFAVWQQHKIAGREAEQRRRKSIAARAVMPAALAEICEYAELSARKLDELYPHNGKVRILAAPFSAPDFPSYAIAVLRDCIEHAEDKDGKRIAECIRKLQIHHSKLSGLISRTKTKDVGRHSFDDILIDTILLHADCSKLFPYARIEDLYQSSNTWEHYLFASMLALNVHEETFPSVFELLRARKVVSW